ncbi:hypothetical protein GCM10010387_18650 [Streptomyces inusitatus]|uniref:Integrin-like protein n=1 Tax=Streptomyces inusitatus TaxID=68221 RepID=A0A918PXN9_9ACTN|nr:FG-GAP-like repeat-containing protein [Streptomyces inusitatus]GGZ25391.1 hypothetical protein GCM10010387_18650 [Streptomyces inusitatus]
MNTRSTARGLGLLTAVAAISTLTAPVALAAPAAPTPVPASSKKLPAQPKDDFNGDGYADLAVGSPQGRIGQENSAGYVSVVYGSESGLNTASKQILHQGSKGIPGTPRAMEHFGTSLTSADFDRDGYADLAIGAEGEAPRPGEKITGETVVVWGGAQGLARAKPTTRFNDHGDELVAGDFDGDGNPDLISARYQDAVLRVLHGPFDALGKPARESSVPTPHPNENEYRNLIGLKAGDVNGDGNTDLVGLIDVRDEGGYWHTGLVSWKGTATGPTPYRYVGDHRRQLIPGESLDVGDVNKDGYADIAVGIRYANDVGPGVHKGGQVTFIKGSAKGPLGSRNRVFHLDSPGVPGSSRTGQGFGVSVSVGDLDGDSYGDIAVGANGTTVDGKTMSGSVITLRGTASGPTSKGAKEFHQNTKGVPGTAEQSDRFGGVVNLIDGNGDGRNELAVSSLHEDDMTGAVWVFKTDKNGVTPNGSFVYGPRALGLPADNELMFGSTYTS